MNTQAERSSFSMNFEIIESRYTRKKYEEIGFKLADRQKATIIWNKPNINLDDKLSALKEIYSNTSDYDLKEQIYERLQFEKMIMEQFETASGNTIYVVFDVEDNYPCGYFQKYRSAYLHAKEYIDTEKTRCYIEKHYIDTSDNTCSEVSLQVNSEHKGDAVACMYLDISGNITKLWSDESAAKRYANLFDNNRFENQYLLLPYVHGEGLIVKYTSTGEYGVIETAEDDWESFQKRVCDGLEADYYDTALTVYFLSRNGNWTHYHCNPIYLENESPKINDDIETESAFYRANRMMSEYLKSHKNRLIKNKLIEATLDYAKVFDNPSIIKQFTFI